MKEHCLLLYTIMAILSEKEDLKEASVIAESLKDERLFDDSSDSSSQDFVNEKDLEKPEAVAIQVSLPTYSGMQGCYSTLSARSSRPAMILNCP